MSSNSSSCYYPNGDPSSDGDIPCYDLDNNNDNVPCCPLNWTCQNNGLCYLAGEDYLGRYTCTDPDWGDGCPEICTYANKASGNEAVLKCETDSYCCDTNRPDLTNPSKACCETTNIRFSLDDRMSALPQGSAPSSTSEAVAFSSEAAASSLSTPPTFSSSPKLSPSFSSESPFYVGPVSSINNPSVSLISSTVSQSATPTKFSASTSAGSAAPAITSGLSPECQINCGGKRNLGAIIGPAVAVPLVLVAIAIAMFFYFRRGRKGQVENSAFPSGFGTEPKYEGEIFPNSHYSIANKSELEGSSPGFSASPATPQTGFSRFDSPKVQSTTLSPDPSSAGLRGSTLSEMSSADQPQIAEVPAGPVH